MSSDKLSTAVKFFIDYHTKNGGTLRKTLWTVSRIIDCDYRQLEQYLHDEINNGMIPAKYGFRKDLLTK